MRATAIALLVFASLAVARAAAAEPQPVDVIVRDAPPERRWVSIEWNPLPLVAISKASGNVVVVPFDHHAIALSPFYSWAKTEPIYVFDDAGNSTQVPEQRFTGFGGEIGYRYYTGLGGPRGFFVGPSFILGIFSAATDFIALGGALDAGYQALVLDRISLSLGGGAQFVGQTRSIPSQQFPANIYANTGVMPRLLFSIGVAL